MNKKQRKAECAKNGHIWTAYTIIELKTGIEYRFCEFCGTIEIIQPKPETQCLSTSG